MAIVLTVYKHLKLHGSGTVRLAQRPRRIASLGTCTLILCATCLGSLAAATLTYSDRSEFLAASESIVGIRTPVSFDVLTPKPYFSQIYGPSLSLSNLTFLGRSIVVSNNPQGTDGPAALMNFDSDPPLTIQVNGSTKAFGADFSSYINMVRSNFTATLDLSNGERFTFLAPANPHFQFFGFITDSYITSITFNGGVLASMGGWLHEEQIRDIFMVREIPEPSTAALATLAFLACLARRSRS